MNSQTNITPHEPKPYKQTLGEKVNNIEQEARMVLPGIQTLFGFQLISVFNQGFKTNLSQNEQYIHLVSLLLVAISAILVVAPAAYHRQAHHHVSEHFVKISSRFLSWALAPLAVGTCIDLYLVTKLILNSEFYSVIISLFIFSIYLGVWFVYPITRAKIKNNK